MRAILLKANEIHYQMQTTKKCDESSRMRIRIPQSIDYRLSTEEKNSVLNLACVLAYSKRMNNNN